MEMAARQGWARFLPRGTPLPEGQWLSRHRVILAILWAHVPLLAGFGLATGHGWGHSLLEASVPALFAAAAALHAPWRARWPRWERSARATLAGAGLISSSAILVHFSAGTIEMHFHFFVMVALMALYQDWPPFLLAILFVGAHHGIMGAMAPTSVYNHPDALAHPWRWAAVHAFFILCASAAAVTAWRYSEQARLETEWALAEADRSRVRSEQAAAEARQALSAHEATLEATADGILVVDRKGRITSANHQFASMWRIPPGLLASGDDGALLAHVARQLGEPEAFLEKVRKLYDTPEAESHDTLEFLDGRVFERDSRPQRVEGKVVGRVWSFRDVTARRRAEQDRILAGQRLAQIRQLEEVDRFKTNLLNTASHELNTPLTPLRLQVRLLQNATAGNLTDRQRRSVDILDRNLQRLTALVSNVLDVSRLQSDRLRIERVPVDLRRSVREVIDSFEESARMQGVFLEAEGDESPLVAHADGDRVTQVLFNLVANALRFSPAAGRVAVSARATAAGGVRVEVADGGRGLTPAERARLFQPFSQLESPGESGGGTGLGLYICRGIVEAHGGAIGVESAGLGHGSRFWFELPPEGGAAPAPHPPRATPMFEHSVQFYASSGFLAEEAAAWLASGLAAGGAAVLLAAADNRVLVEARLRERMVGRPEGWTGRLLCLDADAALAAVAPGGWPSTPGFQEGVAAVVARASRLGNGEVWAFGEMSALLAAGGRPEAAILLEQMWHALARDGGARVLCAYPMPLFVGPDGPDTLVTVCRVHTDARPTERSAVSARQPGGTEAA